MDKKKTIIAVISFVLVCLIALGIYFEVKPTADKTIKYKYVTVEVYYQGQLAHRVTSATSKEYLADYLVDVGIVAEEEKSFFSTVIGIKADYSVDESWWKITKNGEVCQYGAAELPLSDGDKYELTYTVGFDG